MSRIPRRTIRENPGGDPTRTRVTRPIAIPRQAPIRRPERSWPRPAAVALLGLLFVLALAARSATADVRCASDSPQASCRIEVAGGLVFETGRQSIVDLADPEGVEVEGDMALVAGPVRMELAESRAFFARDPRGTLWIEYALVRAPWSSLPVLRDIEYPGELPFVFLGMAERPELRELFEDPDDPSTRLPLAENPDPHHPGRILEPVYLFFNMETGDDMGLPLPLPPEITGGGKAPEIPLASRQVVTVIFDPTDPYVYFSNEGGGGVLEKIEKKAERKLAERLARRGEKRPDDGTKDDKKRKKKNKKHKKSKREKEGKDKKAKKDKKNKKKRRKKDRNLPKGTFAFSGHGGIPQDAGMDEHVLVGDIDVDGHLFIRNPTPIGPFIELEGPTVTHLGEGEFAIWGSGDAEVTLPFVGEIVAFSFPLGKTEAAFEAGERGARADFRGTLAPDAEFLPELVPIKQAGKLVVEGILGSRIADNRVRAEGEFGLDLSGLGRLAGVDLGEVYSVEGVLEMGASGFHLEGTSRSRIPGVRFRGETWVVAHFPGNPEDAYLKIVGDLGVGGIQLGAGASLVIDASGAFVEGRFGLGRSNIAVAGEITRKGPVLTGSTRVVLDLAKLQEDLDRARADIERAQADVRRIDGEIARMREVVRAERRETSRDLEIAQAAVDVAKTRVDSIQRDIDWHNAKIAAYKREIASWKRKSCGWDPICASEKAAAIAWRESKVKFHQGAIGTLVASREAARFALDRARDTLRAVQQGLDALPTDGDPRIVALFAARETAVAALEVAKRAIEGLPPLPPAELVVDVRLTLDRKGLRGDASVAAQGLEVADARVALGRNPEACARVATLGEVCAPI